MQSDAPTLVSFFTVEIRVSPTFARNPAVAADYGEVLHLKIVAALHKDVFIIHINGRIANRRSHV
jgi:hypothetical protein